MASTKQKLLSLNLSEQQLPTSKVSVIGVGQVGMACAFSMLVQGICNQLALCDVDENKLKGELLDLRQSLAFLKPVEISASKDLQVTSNSDVIVITAGARQQPGESRLVLQERNIQIFKDLIPSLVKLSPKTIFIIVSNPVDILTYLTWKLSGLPSYRVIGSGTNLDSARFRHFISKKLDITVNSINGWIIGEHGDSSVPVWSGVNVAGTNLKCLNPKLGKADDPENWNEIHQKVVSSAYEIISLKGYTSWAIGLSVSSICQSILRDEKLIFALSTLLTKWEGSKSLDITEDVFLSLPCVVGRGGIMSIVNEVLDEQEASRFKHSAEKILKEQKKWSF